MGFQKNIIINILTELSRKKVYTDSNKLVQSHMTWLGSFLFSFCKRQQIAKQSITQNAPKLPLTNGSGQKAFLFPFPLRFSNMLLLNYKVILSQGARWFLCYSLFPAIDLPCVCDGEKTALRNPFCFINFDIKFKTAQSYSINQVS